MGKSSEEVLVAGEKLKYDPPKLLHYGALRDLTASGSEPMMEGDGGHAMRMP